MSHLVITGGRGTLAGAIRDAFVGPVWEIHTPGHDELDVTRDLSVRYYFEDREIDLLICNAGVTRDDLLASSTAEDWDHVLDVNYHGAARCVEAVLPCMMERGSGHIIFISSRSAVHPPAGQAAYATAKAAVLGLAASLAKTHGRDGIRVNTILPGFLETRMTASVSPRRKSEILADHALPAFNTVSAVGGFIRHLHDHLPHTSGQVFQLDSRPA